jgi:hypothetical protein
MANSRFPVMRETKDLLRYLLGNEGNFSYARLGEDEDTEDEVDASKLGIWSSDSSPNLPWRSWWLEVGVYVLLGPRARSQGLRLRRNERQRLINLVTGSAKVTRSEQRIFHQRAATLYKEVRQKFMDQARERRQKIVADFLERGSIVFDKASGIRITANQHFEDYLVRFLDLDYAIALIPPNQVSLELVQRLRGLWFGLGLGAYAIEWPAY